MCREDDRIFELKKKTQESKQSNEENNNINAKAGPTRWLRGLRCLLQSLNYPSSIPRTHMMRRENHLLASCPLTSTNIPRKGSSNLHIINLFKRRHKGRFKRYMRNCENITSNNYGYKAKRGISLQIMENILTQTRKLSKNKKRYII